MLLYIQINNEINFFKKHKDIKLLLLNITNIYNSSFLYYDNNDFNIQIKLLVKKIIKLKLKEKYSDVQQLKKIVIKKIDIEDLINDNLNHKFIDLFNFFWKKKSEIISKKIETITIYNINVK